MALLKDLYSIEHVSYNVHLLLHLSESVKFWGPLWATSAFLFENANGRLLRAFHGTKCVSNQIFKQFLHSRSLGQLADENIEGLSNEDVVECYQQLSGSSITCKGATGLNERIFGVDLHRKYNLSGQEVIDIEEMYQCTIVSNKVNLYSHFIIKGCVFHTHTYSMSYKNSDCYVTLVDRKGVFKISALLSVIVRENDEVVEKCVLNCLECFIVTNVY